MAIFKRSKDYTKKEMKYLTNYFKVISGYTPVFATYTGGIYEMGLTRSAVHSIATHCSKLNPVLHGNYKHKKLAKLLITKPNHLMTTQQFLSKLFTILLCENNAFIVPIYSDDTATEIIGLYPVRSEGASIINGDDGDTYLRYKIGTDYYAIEYSKVGHLRNHFYKKDYIADDNTPLEPTMELLNTQNQGIREGIKNSASIRFLARLANTINPEHLKKERKALTEANLSADNNGGIMIFDNKYAEVKEISSTPFIIDSDQMNHIKNNVFDYFHISENIIQNKATEDEWNAFYEGIIEPLALQLGQVLTNMLMENKDIEKGCGVIFESSRLQFASNKTKLEFVTQMFDRGQITTNQALSVFNLPPVKDGDKRYIRKEYTEVNNLDREVTENE